MLGHWFCPVLLSQYMPGSLQTLFQLYTYEMRLFSANFPMSIIVKLCNCKRPLTNLKTMHILFITKIIRIVSMLVIRGKTRSSKVCLLWFVSLIDCSINTCLIIKLIANQRQSLIFYSIILNK